jgi:hypothetical protein
LRLIPFGFLGGAVLWVLVRAVTERRFDAAGKRLLAGAALAFAVGNAVTVAAVGAPAYRDFAHVFARHSHTPAANQLGLTTLLSWTYGEEYNRFVDTRLTEPAEPWSRHQLQRRVERRPIWAVATLSATAVVVVSAAAGLSAAECAALSGLVLFCLLPMTSYDYIWLVFLVALAGRRPRVLPALLAFSVFSHVMFVFGTDDSVVEQHLIGSFVCLVLLVWIADVPALVRKWLPVPR